MTTIGLYAVQKLYPVVCEKLESRKQNRDTLKQKLGSSKASSDTFNIIVEQKSANSNGIEFFEIITPLYIAKPKEGEDKSLKLQALPQVSSKKKEEATSVRTTFKPILNGQSPAKVSKLESQPHWKVGPKTLPRLEDSTKPKTEVSSSSFSDTEIETEKLGTSGVKSNDASRKKPALKRRKLMGQKKPALKRRTLMGSQSKSKDSSSSSSSSDTELGTNKKRLIPKSSNKNFSKVSSEKSKQKR